MFQPPGGLGEWFVALRNAVGIARALGRTLVVPHLLWDGGLSTPVPFSEIFDLGPLRAVVPSLVEMHQFMRLRLAPSRLVLLHVKDPRLIPSRSYFDIVLGWRNLSTVHLPTQMCQDVDYRRLYGGCGERVLAFSHMYAAFEGFADAADQRWLDETVGPALWSDTPSVVSKAERMAQRLRRDTGSYSCIHLTELDTAVINARAPVSDGSLEEDVHSIDVAEPAAHSVPFPRFDDGPGPPNIIRQPLTVCDGYEAEARHAAGRKWVKTHVEQGMACHVTEGVISANLAQLPRRDPVFVLADGQRALSDALAERGAAALGSEFMHIGDLAAMLSLDVRPREWPTLELNLCAQAATLMLNQFSPLSHVLAARSRLSRPAQPGGASVQPPRRQPRLAWWTRTDSDACAPLFTCAAAAARRPPPARESPRLLAHLTAAG